MRAKRTRPQRLISESLKRFNIAAWGRQSGKTTHGLMKMTTKPIQGRKYGVYWYVLQTYRAAEIAFQRFYGTHRESGLLRGRPHFADLYFTIKNHAKIFFMSGEVFQNLRAETLDGAVIDEVRQQNPKLWPLVIRPMLAKRGGWCDFLSTTNGFDHFYDLFEAAKKNPAEWSTFHAASAEAPWWNEAELASARSTMSQAEYDQEILALFRDITRGKAYGSFGDWNDLYVSPFTDDGLVHKRLPVYLGLDFNMAPMAWTLIQGAKSIRKFYAFDMVYIPRTVEGTKEAALVLVDKLKSYGITEITLIGDSTGKANKTSAAGQTDYTILCDILTDAGISWENLTPLANPPVKDRVNCFNAHLKAADGRISFWLHPVNCEPLRRDLQRTTWKPGTGILDEGTEKLLTHASDGVGYVLHEIDPLTLFDDSFELRIV